MAPLPHAPRHGPRGRCGWPLAVLKDIAQEVPARPPPPPPILVSRPPLRRARADLTAEFGAHRQKYGELEMEAARLREVAGSSAQLKADLRHERERHAAHGHERQQLQAAATAAQQRVAELELEAGALRERVVEADRLQHELNAAREKIAIMEQRGRLLERERAGAAQQLQTELDAARKRIEAIEVRRRKRSTGDDGKSSAGTATTSRTAHSAGAELVPVRGGDAGRAKDKPARRHRSAIRARSPRPDDEGGADGRERFVFAAAKKPPRAELRGMYSPARSGASTPH